MTVRSMFAMLFSYAIAATAAAICVLFMLGMDDAARGGIFEWDVGYVIMASVLTASIAFVPFVLALGVLRIVRQTGWLAHLLAGLSVSIAAQLMHFRDFPNPPTPAFDGWEIPTAGAVAGLVYWAVRRLLTSLATSVKSA